LSERKIFGRGSASHWVFRNSTETQRGLQGNAARNSHLEANMSIFPNANFPLLESDQAEVIEIFNALLRGWNVAGRSMEAPVNSAMNPPRGSSDSGFDRDADLRS
jgi:hypothetical protein